jgi:hypothetical protein
MIKNYLITSWRTLIKNKFYTLLNDESSFGICFPAINLNFSLTLYILKHAK